MTGEQEENKIDNSDLEERLKGFTDELAPLFGKYELGLASEASLTKDGKITSRPVLVSTRGRTQLTGSEE